MSLPSPTKKKLVYSYEGYPLKNPIEIDVPKSPKKQILEYLAYKSILTDELREKIEQIFKRGLSETPIKKEMIYHIEGYRLTNPVEVDVPKNTCEQVLEFLENNGILTEELRSKIEKIYQSTKL